MKILKLVFRLFLKWSALRVVKYRGKRVSVNGKTILNSNTTLGSNVHFNGLQIIGEGEVIIGNNFHSGAGCLLIPEIHNYEGTALPYDDTYIRKKIVIEDNVWLGSNVIVLAGVTIGEGAIVQAGAVVVKNVDKCSIVGGNPAKVFKMRNIEHYNSLKEQKRYH